MAKYSDDFMKHQQTFKKRLYIGELEADANAACLEGHCLQEVLGKVMLVYFASGPMVMIS